MNVQMMIAIKYGLHHSREKHWVDWTFFAGAGGRVFMTTVEEAIRIPSTIHYIASQVTSFQNEDGHDAATRARETNRL